MKKITLLLLITLLTLSTSLCAQQQQQQGKFNPQEFRAKLEAYISDKAGFTAADAQAFFPIFHEMKDKQHQLQGQIFQIKKDRPGNDAQDKDFANKVMQINKLKVEMAQLEESYYKKLCKLLPSPKVYKAMLAEDMFHRDMLRNFNQQQTNRQRNGQQGRHNGQRREKR